MTTIKVDYAALENANTQMRAIARTLDEKLDTLKAGLAKMNWVGSDQAAYHAYQTQWDEAVRGINQILNEIGNAVGIARENYVTTETSNAKLWS
jgi:6 kDa early secretory antigenic target